MHLSALADTLATAKGATPASKMLLPVHEILKFLEPLSSNSNMRSSSSSSMLHDLDYSYRNLMRGPATTGMLAATADHVVVVVPGVRRRVWMEEQPRE